LPPRVGDGLGILRADKYRERLDTAGNISAGDLAKELRDCWGVGYQELKDIIEDLAKRNQYPQSQTNTFEAAVYAIRFRICTGWHKFRLPQDEVQARRGAERLSPWLQSRWFNDLVGRRIFREAPPECAGYTWARLRRDGPPYGPDDKERRVSHSR
jgi:hypothetical protein